MRAVGAPRRTLRQIAQSLAVIGNDLTPARNTVPHPQMAPLRRLSRPHRLLVKSRFTGGRTVRRRCFRGPVPMRSRYVPPWEFRNVELVF
jgi:hypothetical protein